jgi:hypothetical protein
MADDTIASVIPLHQVPLKKREKRAAGRIKTDRPRKRKAKVAASEEAEYPSSPSLLPSEFLIPPEFLPANDVAAEPSVAPPAATSHPNEAVTRSRAQLAPVLLSIAALALAIVGITINGWFARSLGSSDFAVLCCRPMAERAARNRIGRLDRLGDDVRICGDGGHRLRLYQYQRRDHCTRLARNAGDCERARSAQRRHGCARPRVQKRRRKILPRTRSCRRRTASGTRLGRDLRWTDRGRPKRRCNQACYVGLPRLAAANAGRLRHAAAGPAGVAAANRRNPAPDRTPFGAEISSLIGRALAREKNGRAFGASVFLPSLGVILVKPLSASGYASCAGRTAPGSPPPTPLPAGTALRSGTPAPDARRSGSAPGKR